LVDLINQHGTARMRIRSALYIVYHHSIHNRFKVAKDLLLKTHIADIISLQDIGTQIIYNRAITQIGMAAFRLGMIEDAHDILVDICQTAKLKEILAQGISRTPDKTIEMEREELKR
jgi:translation initiation factor 3 subunit C